MLDKPEQITIMARRWFQKSWGNTYHSVEIYVDRELLERVPYTYGYGEQYLSTAHRVLQEAGYYPKTDNNMVDYYQFIDDKRDRDNPPYIQVFCTDVMRKRDL